MFFDEGWFYGDPPRCGACRNFQSDPNSSKSYICLIPYCPNSPRYTGGIRLPQLFDTGHAPKEMFADLMRALNEQLKSIALNHRLLLWNNPGLSLSADELRSSLEYVRGGTAVKTGIELLIQHPYLFECGSAEPKVLLFRTLREGLLQLEKAPDPSNTEEALDAIKHSLSGTDEGAAFHAYLCYLAGRVTLVYNGTELDEPQLVAARTQHGWNTLPNITVFDALSPSC